MTILYFLLYLAEVIILAIFFHRLMVKDAYYGLGNEIFLIGMGVLTPLIWGAVTVTSWYIESDEIMIEVEKIRPFILPFGALVVVCSGIAILLGEGIEWSYKKIRWIYNQWLIHRFD